MKNDKIKMQNVLIAINICVCIFLFAVFFNSVMTLIFALSMLTLIWIIIIMSDFYNNIAIIVFEITFLMFISGTIILSFINGDKEILTGLFSEEINIHILICVFISQLIFPIGYFYAKRKSKQRIKELRNLQDMNKLKSIRKIVLFGLLITLIPKIAVAYYSSKMQMDIGYVESYLGYNMNFPSFFIKLSQGYKVFFWLYLATNPSYITTFIILVLNLIVSFIQCMGGHRSYIIVAGLLSIIYLCYRQSIETKRTIWFKKEWMVVIVCLLPLIIVFFVKWSYSRLGLDVKMTVLEGVGEFFESSSADVIGYEQLYNNSIPKGNYTFGAMFTVMIRNQTFLGKLFDFEVLRNNTYEMAQNGRAFGQTITYLVDPSIYYRGGGLGSAYIAEVFHDFGYFGLVMFNFLLGYILEKLYTFKNNNTFIQAMGFMMLESIILIPRESFFSFVYYNVTVTNILYFLVAYLAMKLVNIKRRNFRNDYNIDNQYISL